MQTAMGALNPGNPESRNKVSCTMVCSETKGKNCFGYCPLDKGQSRVPEPPDKITGIILGILNIAMLYELLTRFYKLISLAFII